MAGTIRIWLTLLIVSGSACRPSDSAGGSGALVRDSAGVRIVENVSPAWTRDQGWTLSDRPILEVGVAEGEPAYMFSAVFRARRRPDGSILVFDLGAMQFRLFDSAGRHVRSIGGLGDGPGEFQGATSFDFIAGDSLIVWDGVARRATVFSPEWDVARTFTLAEGSFRAPAIAGVFSGGNLFVRASPLEEPSEIGPRWATYVLIRSSADGQEPVVLGSAPYRQCDPADDLECSTMAYGGTGGLRLHDDRIYLFRSDRYEISVLDSDGRLTSRFYGPEPSEPVTAAMRQEFHDAIIAGNPSRESQAREYLTGMSFAEVVPAFSTVIVGLDGHVWLQEYRVEGNIVAYVPRFPPRTTPVRWTVFDPQGILLGDVMVPANYQVVEIGANYMLGVTRDELGVEKVHMYDIVKS